MRVKASTFVVRAMARKRDLEVDDLAHASTSPPMPPSTPPRRAAAARHPFPDHLPTAPVVEVESGAITWSSTGPFDSGSLADFLVAARCCLTARPICAA